MARKDIPDWLVCASCVEFRKRNHLSDNIVFAIDILMEWTGEPEKVCYAAMERTDDRGYIDYGVSLRTSWVTDEGAELLEKNAPEELLSELRQGIDKFSYSVYD